MLIPSLCLRQQHQLDFTCRICRANQTNVDTAACAELYLAQGKDEDIHVCDIFLAVYMHLIFYL